MNDKQPGHVRQALGELDNARELGNPEAERAARKRLAAAGVTLDDDTEAPATQRRRPPTGRRTPADRRSTT